MTSVLVHLAVVLLIFRIVRDDPWLPPERALPIALSAALIGLAGARFDVAEQSARAL
jgi:hypothetical protein